MTTESAQLDVFAHLVTTEGMLACLARAAIANGRFLSLGGTGSEHA